MVQSLVENAGRAAAEVCRWGAAFYRQHALAIVGIQVLPALHKGMLLLDTQYAGSGWGKLMNLETMLMRGVLVLSIVAMSKAQEEDAWPSGIPSGNSDRMEPAGVQPGKRSRKLRWKMLIGLGLCFGLVLWGIDLLLLRLPGSSLVAAVAQWMALTTVKVHLIAKLTVVLLREVCLIPGAIIMARGLYRTLRQAPQARAVPVN